MEGNLKPKPRWPWVLWAFTSLVLAGMASSLREIIRQAVNHYEYLQLVELPDATALVLFMGPCLWIAALAGSGLGAYLMKRNGRQSVIPWCLFSTVACVGLATLVAWALYLPLLKIQQNLSR